MALAVPVYLKPVRGYLYVAVWDPVIVLSGYPVDSKVDIYRDRLKSVAVGVVDADVQLLDGLWFRFRFWLWLWLWLWFRLGLWRNYRIALWQVPVGPIRLALVPAPHNRQQYKKGTDMLYWHTASQRHAAPCGFCDTTSRSTLPS